jgi:hypothetical protein
MKITRTSGKNRDYYGQVMVIIACGASKLFPQGKLLRSLTAEQIPGI